MYGVINVKNEKDSSYKHVSLKSNLVENNVDPDQTASTEASYSGSTVLPKRIQSVKHKKVKSPTRVLFVPKITFYLLLSLLSIFQ